MDSSPIAMSSVSYLSHESGSLAPVSQPSSLCSLVAQAAATPFARMSPLHLGDAYNPANPASLPQLMSGVVAIAPPVLPVFNPPLPEFSLGAAHPNRPAFVSSYGSLVDFRPDLRSNTPLRQLLGDE